MIDTLPPPVQRRYLGRAHLVTRVEQLGGRITITRVTPVKRVLSRDRWWYNGRGWEKISTGRVLHVGGNTMMEAWQQHVRDCQQCEAEALVGLTEDHVINPNNLCLKGQELYKMLGKLSEPIPGTIPDQP